MRGALSSATGAAVRPADYHRLSVSAKAELAIDRMREPAIACPHCEARTTVADLLRHVAERCSGVRAPHELSRWVSLGAAVVAAPRATIIRWAASGRVQTREGIGRREYLLRDIVRLAAMRGCRDERPRRVESGNPPNQLELELEGLH